MVAVMVWRPQGLMSHREPTIKLSNYLDDHPVGSPVIEKTT